MQEVLKFCLRHIDTIVSIVLVICSLIIFAVKKPVSKNIDDTIKSKLLEDAPQYIELIEQSSNLSGVEKKKFVTEALLKIVKRMYGRTLTELESMSWQVIISDVIESILACPQKKEVKGEI